jgi:hypothetical protein
MERYPEKSRASDGETVIWSGSSETKRRMLPIQKDKSVGMSNCPMALDEAKETDGEGKSGDHGSSLSLSGATIQVESDSTGGSSAVLSTRSSGLQSSGRQEGVDDLYRQSNNDRSVFHSNSDDSRCWAKLDLHAGHHLPATRRRSSKSWPSCIRPS